MENAQAKQDTSKKVLKDVIQTFLVVQAISVNRNPLRAIEIANQIIDGKETQKNQAIQVSLR